MRERCCTAQRNLCRTLFRGKSRHQTTPAKVLSKSSRRLNGRGLSTSCSSYRPAIIRAIYYRRLVQCPAEPYSTGILPCAVCVCGVVVGSLPSDRHVLRTHTHTHYYMNCDRAHTHGLNFYTCACMSPIHTHTHTLVPLGPDTVSRCLNDTRFNAFSYAASNNGIFT